TARAGEAQGQGVVDLLLPPERTRALQEQARGWGVTMSTLVQGAWALLLARYAGEEDVVFGATASGRPPELAGVEEMVGLFINTLPVRVRLPGEATLREWLGTLQKEQVEAREYEYAPLVEVQKWSGLPAGDGLFETLVVFENYPVDQAVEQAAGRPGGLQIRPSHRHEQANYPLVLSAQAGARLKSEIRFDRARVEAAAVDRLGGHLQTVLEAMAADPRRRLAELSLLRDDERAQLLAASRTEALPHPAACVHELLAEQAARTPDAVAVSCGEETLTFAELELRANKLAHLLLRLGAGPEARVGVCLERGPEMLVAVLGVLKAGGAYVPLDPSYPAERLEYALSDSGATVLLTRTLFLHVLPAFGGRTVYLDAARQELEREPGTAPGSGAGVRSAAYVIYTSGSTGRPKGVVVEHASLTRTLLSTRDTYGFAAGDVMPVMASYAFDIWAFETFAPLLAGGAVRLLARETVQDVEQLVDELAGVDAVHAVPALMREVVQRVQAGPGVLPRMRSVFIGGDAIAPDLLEDTRAAFPAARVWAMYGPTEGTIISSATPLEGGGRYDWQMVGRPLPGVGMHVCDPAGSLLPAGVPGELCLAGAGVVRGYLGRPDLTAERFVPDAFSGDPGARLYRTGDRVRRRTDGELEFLGRVDQQVKIRGFRIELGEVEAVLAEHPDLREAAVLAHEDLGGQKRLLAFVVPAGEAALSGAELKEYAAARLPDYMVPASYVILDEMPRTPTGKLDRRALPVPQLRGAAPYEAPRTPVEELLCEIIHAVLSADGRSPRERVGIQDNFFELGGHSLLAAQVATRIRAALGVELGLRALFEAPTVAALAAEVEALRGAGAAAAPPIERVPRDGPLPLSFAQQRLWLVDRLEPGSAAYNMPYALRLRGGLDVRSLRAALDALVARHESLRTTFVERGGAPVQVIHDAAPARLSLVDLRGLPAGARERQAERLVGAEALRPFDLARGPLLRTLVVRTGPDEHVLSFTLHHVVSDGWSMQRVLIREVSALYAAFTRGEEPRLPELEAQYADYAVWQRGWLTGEVLDAQIG
ncbi:MAG TPA: amino acid adenylation domain-containing protein, partial [Longimicrobiaceae bacterium]|nr:amino acid adenylation domain-containing protein [Longimicrobiaceae bacterium]